MIAPTPAVAKRLRDILLSTPIPNPLDAGAMASLRNVPGDWPHKFCLYFGVFTPEEIEPRFREWVEFERDARGLGTDTLAMPMTHVYKATHFTVAQHWVIGKLSCDGETRKLARAQALHLRKLILTDDVVTAPDWVGPSRGIGWSAQGLHLDFLMTHSVDAFDGAARLLHRLKLGNECGVPFIWRNPNALKDPNHQYESSPWMDSTAIHPLALFHTTWQAPASRDLLLHGLRCLAYAQMEDGKFHDDYQPGQPGVFHDAPGESTETFIWPALFAAKDALGKDWPPWAEAMLDKCRLRYLALNRFKPNDSGFTSFHNMSIAIAAAPVWGWRDP